MANLNSWLQRLKPRSHLAAVYSAVDGSILREISQKSVGVLKEMGPKIQWLHSYVTGNKIYCVYLAPDEATVQEHAKRVGLIEQKC